MQVGDLVKYDHPANPTVGIVKSITQHSSSGDLVLVQWCNERQAEENISDQYLKLVGDQ